MTTTQAPTTTHRFYFTNSRGMFLKHLTLSGVSMSWDTKCFFTATDALRLIGGPCAHLELNEIS